MLNTENSISNELERLDAIASDMRKMVNRLLEAEQELYTIQKNLYEKGMPEIAKNNQSVSPCSFLGKTVPVEKLRELCEEYSIEADEGATYKELLDKVVLHKAANGDKEAAKLVKEYCLHE